MQVNIFKGLRNDKNKKFIEPNYFHEIVNFNYDDLYGANKIKFPKQIYDNSSSDDVLGIFDYRYLNVYNKLEEQNIAIIGDKMYLNFDSTSPQLIISNLEVAKWQATVYKDKLFLCNGHNYPKIWNGTVLTEMGAPVVTNMGLAGNLNGTYYYEITYVTSGGEERLGTQSNIITVTNHKVSLELPIGYSGTTARKIYRTKNGGTDPKLVTTISDNTTLTYEDNTADGALGADIISLSVIDECPKPYFLEVNYNKLIGCTMDAYPTQLVVSDTNIEIFDIKQATDISNQAGDNTPVKGMKLDYNKIIVGSEREIYVIDVSASTTSVVLTRSNLGLKNGYTMEKIPSSEGFPGGIVFVSSLNDVRLFSGNFAQPVATSLDNLATSNWSQWIQRTFIYDVENSNNLYAKFYNYKYHLIVDQKFYVFDIRTNGWTTYFIKTDSYNPMPNVLGIVKEKLFLGLKGQGIIEQFYYGTQYKSEEVISYFKTPALMFSPEKKFISSIIIFYRTLNVNKWTIEITLDGYYENSIIIKANFKDGAFSQEDFDPVDFSTVKDIDDFKDAHINQYARFIEFKITVDAGSFFFRGFKLEADETSNKEIAIR